VLDGLRRLFESQPDFEVAECCADGRAALEAVRDDEVVEAVRLGATGVVLKLGADGRLELVLFAQAKGLV
jgi:hypothetical protein